MKKVFFASLLMLAAIVVSSATAGKPVLTRIEVDESVLDADLTAACGVAVTTHARGHVIIREFDREKGTVGLTTLNVSVTATANGNSYRFRDVGADHVKITKDGPVLSIIGQLPFDFTGVLKVNLDTGEVIHEPSHDISGRIEEACATLTA
jgi:hypothetical protein